MRVLNCQGGNRAKKLPMSGGGILPIVAQQPYRSNLCHLELQKRQGLFNVRKCIHIFRHILLEVLQRSLKHSNNVFQLSQKPILPAFAFLALSKVRGWSAFVVIVTIKRPNAEAHLV